MTFRRTKLTELSKKEKRDLITERLAAHGGNVSAAAADLGVHRVHLHRVMRELGITAFEHRPAP